MDYHSVLAGNNLLFTVLSPAALTVLIFLAILLFILSFLVAGSQVAFFSMNVKDINVLKTRKQPSFRRIVNLMEQPKTLLASMLITNSFVNIGAILISNILIDNWLLG
ncbi:MAG TPA: DUF21 domain-containing protein, partial [Ferruginibacter sp.]|nr:DUF21 domain-containing protein [Ferruginibacter sp.]